MVAFKTNKTQKTPEKVYFFTSEESCFPTQRIMLPWRHKVSALWLVRWRTVDLFSITSWNLTLLTSLRITHTYLASLLAGGWLFFRLFWTSWSSGIGSERKLETPPATKLGFFQDKFWIPSTSGRGLWLVQRLSEYNRLHFDEIQTIASCHTFSQTWSWTRYWSSVRFSTL